MDDYNCLHYAVCNGNLADIQRLESLSCEEYFAILLSFQKKIELLNEQKGREKK